MPRTTSRHESRDYYVYVYIDPRNFQEFYYGKGKGRRKEAHLKDTHDTEKTRRIAEITKAGLKPIIRVVVRDLTEQEALLVEKTLLWKLGETLTNLSGGHYKKNFRPNKTMYTELFGFDFHNDIYYLNVGEGTLRNWDDCRRYGYLAAGQHPVYSAPIRTLVPGDIVVAYLKRHGYVGIGKVTGVAVKVDEFRYKGKSLRNLRMAAPDPFMNHDNENSDYLVPIRWISAVDRTEAKWKKGAGLFTSQQIKASLGGQPKTIRFLEKAFGVSLVV
jgi:hypothetical protein